MGKVTIAASTVTVAAVALGAWTVMAPAAGATVLRKVNPATHSRVADVVDGDTIHVRKGHALISVRLIGINAPEIRHGSWGANQCGGPQATQLVKHYLKPGVIVTLTRAPHRDNFDSYGRALRYVSIHGHDLGALVLRSGWAEAAYDSGRYGIHPKRAWYHRLDAKHNQASCTSLRAPRTVGTTHSSDAGGAASGLLTTAHDGGYTGPRCYIDHTHFYRC